MNFLFKVEAEFVIDRQRKVQAEKFWFGLFLLFKVNRFSLTRSSGSLSSIFVFEARIKLFELKIIVSFETRVDTGLGDKIELEGH